MYNDLCTGANVDIYIMDGRFVLKEKQKTLSSVGMEGRWYFQNIALHT